MPTGVLIYRPPFEIARLRHSRRDTGIRGPHRWAGRCSFQEPAGRPVSCQLCGQRMAIGVILFELLLVGKQAAPYFMRGRNPSLAIARCGESTPKTPPLPKNGSK